MIIFFRLLGGETSVQKRGRKSVLGINKFSGLIIFLITGLVMFGAVLYFDSNVENKFPQDSTTSFQNSPNDIANSKPKAVDGLLNVEGYFDEIELISENGSRCGIDVAQGSIVFTSDIPKDDFNLCYKDTTWHIRAEVIGGYKPSETGTQVLHIYQKGKEYTFDIVWNMGIGSPDSCIEIFTGTINIDKLFLESNRLPALSNPDGTFGLLDMKYCYDDEFIVGKEVSYVAEMKWEGCWKPDQIFTIISIPHNLIPVY